MNTCVYSSTAQQRHRGWALALGLITLSPWGAYANDQAGRIKISLGQVNIERQGQISPGAVGATVVVGDRVRTGANGRVGITLNDNTLLSAGPNALLELKDFRFDTTTHQGSLKTHLTQGALAVVSGKIAKTQPKNVEFSTPSLTLGVRGTEFILEAAGESQP